MIYLSYPVNIRVKLLYIQMYLLGFFVNEIVFQMDTELLLCLTNKQIKNTLFVSLYNFSFH